MEQGQLFHLLPIDAALCNIRVRIADVGLHVV